MLFDEEDASLLKKWIVKRLEDMYARHPTFRAFGKLTSTRIVLTRTRTSLPIMCWLFYDTTRLSKK